MEKAVVNQTEHGRANPNSTPSQPQNRLPGHVEVRSVGDMLKSPSSQYDLKSQEDNDPRGIRVTNEPMR